MASVNWQKQTKQKAAAMKKHNGQQERMQYNHANQTIDKKRTPDNYCIGCDDYNTAFEEMVKRVEAVDKEHPPEKITKDRKICCSLETPCPLKITEAGRSREFFEAVHEVMVDFFGAENVHGACVHLDEVHDYVDEKTGEVRTSLEHSTELVSCYAEWQEPVWERDENGRVKTEPAFDKKGNPLLDKDGNQRERRVQAKDENGELLYTERKGINGKNFETRSALNELNKRVCDMVRERFGIEYNTGERARGKTVEALKAQTAEREAKQKAEQAQSEERKARERVEQVLRELADLSEQVRIARLNAVEIPTRPAELPHIQKPEEPKNPRTVMGWTDADVREYKKVHHEWEKECKKIDKQNIQIDRQNALIRQQQAEWDNSYGVLQTLRDEAKRLAKHREEQDIKDVQQSQKDEALNCREQLIEGEVQKRCDERLARSERYASFRTNQQSSQAFQQKLQTLTETAKARNNSYDNNVIEAESNCSQTTKSQKEFDDRQEDFAL